jgi:cation diffusion facilitator CzcD-associated flavoprotein CzcO
VWSALYSYSFAKNPDWTREYPGQEEILQYLINVAQEYKLYPHFRFNTMVEDATWDDEVKKWKVHVKTAPGSKEAEYHPDYEIKADFIVSAVGQLNQPQWPDIPGVEDFEGKKMHSARWDWSYDLQDKKIALVGNGKCCDVSALHATDPRNRMYSSANPTRDPKSGQACDGIPTNSQLGDSSPGHRHLCVLANHVPLCPRVDEP